MAGRPPLGIGKAGTITTKEIKPDGPNPWRARCNFRDYDGVTRPVERWGPTKAKAKRNLQDELDGRVSKGTGKLTENSRISDAAELYLKKIRKTCVGTTYDGYACHVRNHVVPALGQLRIPECTVSRLEDMFDDLADSGLALSSRQVIRAVTGGVLQVAVRHEVLVRNPVKDMSRLSARNFDSDEDDVEDEDSGDGRKQPRSLTSDELVEFLALLDADRYAPQGDLPDLVRLMLGSGLRLGEALALRWKDLELASTAEKSKLRVTGNIVYVIGKGLLRHSGKTFKSKRTIDPLPEYLLPLLMVRRPQDSADSEPVFPSRSLGWRRPQVVSESIARFRKRISPADDPDRWEWLTSHILRKTVATLLDDAGLSAREIADILGHKNPSMTQNVYMGRGQRNEKAAKVLQLGAR